MDAPSQWEMTLHCIIASHWLGAHTKRFLIINASVTSHHWHHTIFSTYMILSPKGRMKNTNDFLSRTIFEVTLSFRGYMTAHGHTIVSLSMKLQYPIHRADSRFAPSQWETWLQSNAVSHWLGANLESAVHTVPKVPYMPSTQWIFHTEDQ